MSLGGMNPPYPTPNGVALNQKEMTDKDIDPSKTVSELSGDEMRALYRAYQNSDVAHTVDHLEVILERSQTLTNWEIERLNKVFQKFTSKFNSPLAKALK